MNLWRLFKLVLPPAISCAALLPLAAHAQQSKFDGTWSVVMVCPPHSSAKDDAKGYTHRFSAEVLNSRLKGTHGKEGEPGWHFLHGKINADGSASLRLDGIVNTPTHAINEAPQGKEYTYGIKAQFDATAGEGQRLTGRICQFKFSRM